MVQCLRCHAPNMQSPSWIPSQETRSHTPQLNPRQLNKFFLILFTFGCVGSSLFAGFSLAVECGLLFVAALFLQTPGSRGQTQKLWRTGSATTRHVRSSLTRAEPVPRALQADSLPPELPGKPCLDKFPPLDGGKGEESVHPPDQQRLKMFDTARCNRYDFVLQHSGTRNVTLLICLNPAKQAPTLQDWQKKKKKIQS